MYKVMVFGTGSCSARVVHFLPNQFDIIAYIDNDRVKTNKIIGIIPVILPNRISDYCYDYIIIASQSDKEIRKQLLKLNVPFDKIISYDLLNILGFPDRDDNKNLLMCITDRKRLVNNNFSIVSNNCWGWCLYVDLGLAFNTPFIGTLIPPECFIKLIKDLRYYLNLRLEFAKMSKYDFLNRDMEEENYPLGLLGDVEVHFRHEHDEKEAYNKWYRRLERFNYNNVYIKFSDGYGCREESVLEFDRLDFRSKIIVSEQKYPNLRSCVCIGGENDKIYISDYIISKRKFDLIKWINDGGESI